MKFLKLPLTVLIAIYCISCTPITSGGGGVTPSGLPENLVYTTLFDTVGSFFYQKLTANIPDDINSDKYMERINSRVNTNGAVIAFGDYGRTIFYTDVNTPAKNLRMAVDGYYHTNGYPCSYGLKTWYKGIRIPTFANGNLYDNDGPLMVIDKQLQCVWEVWGYNKTLLPPLVSVPLNYSPRGWFASSISINGDGIYKNGIGSCDASGFSGFLGLIWPQELIDGHINHVIKFAYDSDGIKDDFPRLPATFNDGTSFNDSAIVEGTMVQMDPTIDINSLGLSYTNRVIAKCLQDYGMILSVNGGPVKIGPGNPPGIMIYCVSKFSSKNNPYDELQAKDPSFNPNGGGFVLDPVIFQHCRIVAGVENTNPARSVSQIGNFGTYTDEQ